MTFLYIVCIFGSFLAWVASTVTVWHWLLGDAHPWLRGICTAISMCSFVPMVMGIVNFFELKKDAKRFQEFLASNPGLPTHGEAILGWSEDQGGHPIRIFSRGIIYFTNATFEITNRVAFNAFQEKCRELNLNFRSEENIPDWQILNSDLYNGTLLRR